MEIPKFKKKKEVKNNKKFKFNRFDGAFLYTR